MKCGTQPADTRVIHRRSHCSRASCSSLDISATLIESGGVSSVEAPDAAPWLRLTETAILKDLLPHRSLAQSRNSRRVSLRLSGRCCSQEKLGWRGPQHLGPDRYRRGD